LPGIRAKPRAHAQPPIVRGGAHIPKIHGDLKTLQTWVQRQGENAPKKQK
jgi:hypothetical protein